MRSLNKAISLIFFLLINIVCINCPPTDLETDTVPGTEAVTVPGNEDLTYDELFEGCKNDLLHEFKDGNALDHFLHAFLNIKYYSVFWNKDININEQIFWGNGTLRKPAIAYYFELYYTGLDMNLPTIPSPKEFCEAEYRSEEKDCRKKIAAIGCKANFSGNICFRHMFIHWRNIIEPGTLPGTENLSDKELFQVVSKGAASFSNLSLEDLLERISDKILLQDFYSDNEDRCKLKQHLKNMRRKYESSIFESGVEGSQASDEEFYRVNTEYYGQKLKDLQDARFRIYGNGDLPYEDLFNEYNRRQSRPKSFDKYYAMHISKIIKNHHEIFEVDNRFKSHEEYCIKYLEQQSNLLNLYNFNMLYM